MKTQIPLQLAIDWLVAVRDVLPPFNSTKARGWSTVEAILILDWEKDKFLLQPSLIHQGNRFCAINDFSPYGSVDGHLRSAFPPALMYSASPVRTKAKSDSRDKAAMRADWWAGLTSTQDGREAIL